MKNTKETKIELEKKLEKASLQLEEEKKKQQEANYEKKQMLKNIEIANKSITSVKAQLENDKNK